MTSPGQYGSTDGAGRSAEDTLRLVAGLPAPEGLGDRVHARLRTAPRRAGLLHWPIAPLMGYRFHSPALRTAAAAILVCVVAGGGWQICSHVQGVAGGSATVQPARVGNSGGFSNAGAMRTPDTLDRPVLKQPVISSQQDIIAPQSPKTMPETKNRKAIKHGKKLGLPQH